MLACRRMRKRQECLPSLLGSSMSKQQAGGHHEDGDTEQNIPDGPGPLAKKIICYSAKWRPVLRSSATAEGGSPSLLCEARYAGRRRVATKHERTAVFPYERAYCRHVGHEQECQHEQSV